MAGTLLNNTIDKTDANQQMASTINQGGLLMRMAKGQGAQQAGSRGLINSSIGGEASQRAIVAAAQPLALQNTQFAQSKDINQQQADLTAKRDETQQGYNKENMGLQFGYSTKLNDQQNAFTGWQNELNRTQQTNLQNDAQDFTAGQSALDRTQQTNLTNLQFQNQSYLNNQQNQATTARDASLFGYDQRNKATDFHNQLMAMDQQQRLDLQKLGAQTAATKDINAQQQQYALTNTAKQVAANTQGMYLDAINGLTSTFGDQVATINASSMKAADKTNSINSLISAQNSMLKFYQSTYQNMSTIKDDWINVDVSTLPTGSVARLA
jgi:hypothetical protein